MLSSSVTQEGSYASHYAWVLLRPISPHLSRGQRCISYYYFQTFAYQCRFASPVRPDCVVLTCSSLNHDSSTQTIRNGLSTAHLAAAGNRAYMQSLISLALSICRIFPIDDSIGDSLLGFRQALFFSLIVISSLTVLMSPLVASLVFTCFEFSFSILLASIRQKGI